MDQQIRKASIYSFTKVINLWDFISNPSLNILLSSGCYIELKILNASLRQRPYHPRLTLPFVRNRIPIILCDLMVEPYSGIQKTEVRRQNICNLNAEPPGKPKLAFC
jgi:hypothetical protein